jgi:hypothetical protein
MANKKTSEFNDASTLTGTEIFGLVQSGTDVKTTFDNIKSGIVGAPTRIAIGHNASQDSDNSVTIGPDAYSRDNFGIAVGKNANSRGTGSIVIGGYSSTSNSDNKSIVIGYQSSANESFQISIGAYTTVQTGRYAIAIGSYSSSLGESSVAIGNSSYTADFGSVAIGYDSRAINRGVAIGYGSVHTNSNYGVSIGGYSTLQNAYSGIAIGIGAENKNSDRSIAIGANSYAGSVGDRNVVVGSNAAAIYGNATAIGGQSYARDNGTAVGRNASSRGSYAIAVGADTYSSTNSVAIGGNAVGHKSIAIGGQTFGLYSIRIGKNGVAFNANSIALGHNAYDLTIGSFNITGYPHTFNGWNTQQKTVHLKLSGVTTSGHTQASLNAVNDENNTDFENTFALEYGVISTVSGTVVGFNSSIVDDFTGDTASYILNPVIIQRNSSNGVYNIVGSTDFVLSQATAGASGWIVPTLSNNSLTNNDARILINTFDQGSGDICWLAFLTIETHNGND